MWLRLLFGTPIVLLLKVKHASPNWRCGSVAPYEHQALYSEVAAVPITCILTNAPLAQMVRLHLTILVIAPSQILKPEQAHVPPTLYRGSPAFPWLDTDYSIYLHIPGLGRKGSLPDAVIRYPVETHLKEAYEGFHGVCTTDGSVRRASRSATAAFPVPTIGHIWGAQLNCSASSTTAVWRLSSEP